MHSYLALLLSASPLLLAGCGTFVTDSVIEPYKSESYKLIGERAVVNGGYVASEMWPAKNVIYGERGPFSMAIVFSGMRDSGKVAAIRSLEVTADGETLFSRRFSSLRSVYFAYDAPGVRNYSRKIDGVRVIANGPLSFNFGGLFRVEAELTGLGGDGPQGFGQLIQLRDPERPRRTLANNVGQARPPLENALFLE